MTSASCSAAGAAFGPATASVQTSGVQQFTATGRWSDGTTGPLAVAWSATGGLIGSTGLYTAGSTAGSYEVTALGGTLVGRAAVTIVQPSPPTGTFSVPGGTASSPTALGSVLSTQTGYTDFVLEDGYYAATTITRPGIRVRARTACQARIQPELAIHAANVVVDGVAVTAAAVAISVTAPGVHIENSCVQGFGKSQYGNGIWVMQEALDPNNHIIIRGNRLDDWGGAQYSGGIAIGKAADDASQPTAISVEVLNNVITRGPTAPGIYNAAIQYGQRHGGAEQDLQLAGALQRDGARDRGRGAV